LPVLPEPPENEVATILIAAMTSQLLCTLNSYSQSCYPHLERVLVTFLLLGELSLRSEGGFITQVLLGFFHDVTSQFHEIPCLKCMLWNSYMGLEKPFKPLDFK
jgi:hypothetical protein